MILLLEMEEEEIFHAFKGLHIGLLDVFTDFCLTELLTENFP